MRSTIFAASLAVLLLVPATLARAQSADDKAMAQHIGRSLKDSGQLRDYRIGVKYQNGTAWLSGNVANEQQLATAMRLTQQMPGVSQVVNNLTITGQPAAASSAPPLELRQPLQQATAQGSSFNSAFNLPPAKPRAPAYTPIPATPPPSAMQMPRQNYRTAAAQPLPPQGMPRRPTPTQARPAQARPMQPRMMPARPMPPRPMPRPMYQQTSYNQPAGPMRGNGPMQAGYHCECDGGYGGGMMDGGAVGPGPSAMGYVPGAFGGGVSYDNASMPAYAWPSYASYPNYAALTYPRQYSPTAWPYIGPFYPYPQVPLGWRKVSLEWDDGWWFLDFSDCGSNH